MIYGPAGQRHAVCERGSHWRSQSENAAQPSHPSPSSCLAGIMIYIPAVLFPIENFACNNFALKCNSRLTTTTASRVDG